MHYLRDLKHTNLKTVNKYKLSYEFPSFGIQALMEISNMSLSSFSLYFLLDITKLYLAYPDTYWLAENVFHGCIYILQSLSSLNS